MVGTTNRYFQNFSSPTEQNLLDSLINESIRQFGVDCLYIPRHYNAWDPLYGTDTQSSYTNYYTLALYMNTPLGFTGDREFMSKFAGLEIRDQLRFSVPIYAFNQVVAADAGFPPLPGNEPGPGNRPREGDLIWFPFNQKCFQIKFVNLTDMFWQLGKLYTWEITTELFEYSGETINTGIPSVDRLQVRGDLNMLNYLVTDTDGVTPILLDPTSDYWLVDSFSTVDITKDNETINKEANTYIDWDVNDIDPFASANTGNNFSSTI